MALLKLWPNVKGLPRDGWFHAWMALSPADRHEAERLCPAWHALLKKQGRDYPNMPSTYFEKRLWETLEDEDIARVTKRPRETVAAVIFGKAFAAGRLALLAAPSAPLPPMNRWAQMVVDKGGESAAEEIYQHSAKHGWPSVLSHDELAERSRHHCVTVAIEVAALGDDFEAVRVGSEAWEQWRAEHRRRGWPWLPKTGNHEWVYFPALNGGAPADAIESFFQKVNQTAGEAECS